MKKLISLLFILALTGCSNLPNLDNSKDVTCYGYFPVYDFPYTGKPKMVYIKLDKVRENEYKTTYRYAKNNLNLKIHGSWINADTIEGLQCLSE
ncbi:hypothetical protein [Vibrio phage vB_VibM_83AMN]|nr:hypothetical protein [Vibrio phage vB_VibM_83AMN]